MYTATGDKKYLAFLDREFWMTSEFLYDKSEHLYFRDSTYFEKREANGKKIFWSRGNGWVLAGLARVLQYLPPDFPHRSLYEEQFKEMAAKVASLQQPDGLWRPSLLDPVSYPLKETSGSGFYTFGLAWGLNHGLLDRQKYEPIVLKSWKALTECVTPEGKLEHVQPVGADPKKFDPEHTEVFGVGAFLLAGSEMYRLCGGK
jgi:rhamnogalacturonyl hydrolase YesR